MQKPAFGSGNLNVHAAEFQPSFLQQPPPAQAPVPAYGQHDAPVDGAWTEAGFGGESDAAAQEWAANHWAAYMGQVRCYPAPTSYRYSALRPGECALWTLQSRA